MKTRHPLIAQFINKCYRFYWWFRRPVTHGVKMILRCADKVLFVRLTYYPNTWTFPGGGVDKKEDVAAAAVRECREEVGISVEGLLTFVGKLEFEHEYKKDTVHVYELRLDREHVPKIDGIEVAQAEWFSLDNLPSMGPNAKKILALYHQKRN